MKPLTPLLRAGLLLGAVCVASATPAENPREDFLTAKQTAIDANYRNDQAGLHAALGRFDRLSSDAQLGPRAAYHAAWCEWMLAASYFVDNKSADAVAVLESGVARLRRNLEAAPDDAEVHALLGWMLMAVGSGDPKRFPELAPLVRHHRARALELAPACPRAVMLEATMYCYSPKPGHKERGFARWQETLRLLRDERIDDPTLPDWGLTLADGWLANLILTLDPARMADARRHAEQALTERPDWLWVQTQVLPKIKPAQP
jgi:hypothetical protein